jgi:uncharacterized membrane protein YtjA (UPF0391 family)
MDTTGLFRRIDGWESTLVVNQPTLTHHFTFTPTNCISKVIGTLIADGISIGRLTATQYSSKNRKTIMLNWALTFLVIALIAGVLGFGVIAGTAATIAKVLFFVFLVLFVVGLLMGRRAPAV